MYGVFDNSRLIAVSDNLKKLDDYLIFHFESIGGIPKRAEDLINEPYNYDGYGDSVYIIRLDNDKVYTYYTSQPS